MPVKSHLHTCNVCRFGCEEGRGPSYRVGPTSVKSILLWLLGQHAHIRTPAQAAQVPSPSFAELLLLLWTVEDREAAKAQRMKQYLGSKARARAHTQYTLTTPEETKVDALTTITQQLTQQLADIQKQLVSLTVQSNRKQPTSSKPTHVSRLSESMKPSKVTPRCSHKTPSSGP